MKRKIEFVAESEDLGTEKVRIIVYIENQQIDFFDNITESTQKRVEYYKDKIHQMLTDKFHVSQIKILGNKR